VIQKENILKEAIYKAVRSGGSGGQHVNKVATCVQLFFDIHQSEVLDENQKNKLSKSLKNRINVEGVLMLECSESRSQAQNKKMVGDKFFNLLIESFKEKKRRIKTHTPTAIKEKRLKEKKLKSEVKANRNFRM
jgi:ribosome-associated protein